MKNYLIIILLLDVVSCFSQTEKDSLVSNSIYHANTLSVHPFGVFMSRINHNFQLRADKKMSVTTNLTNGNVWLPNVKAYYPMNNSDRNNMAAYVWHKREEHYDVLNTPARTSEFHADGVIRQYQVKLNLPISDQQELKISTRMFSLDAGNVPYSLLTSDQFIEWFHSNVAGGEDPFAREEYGLNQAKIRYTDKKGKTLKLDNGDFIFSGIDFSYYYYPKSSFLDRHNLFTNIGIQVGANVSRINPSLDIGLNFSTIKKMDLRKNRALHLGLSLGAIQLKALQKKNNIELSNNNYLLSAELFLEFVKQTKNGNIFSIATSYYAQSPYNNRQEFEYVVFTGDRISSHWDYAFSHMYKILTGNNLTFTYAKGIFAYSISLREDLLVDNAPDAQVNFGLKVNIK
jgi:hypothetical protein